MPGIKYIECNIQNTENIQLNVGRWYSNLGKLVMIFVVCLVWLNYDKQGLSVRYNMSFKVHDLQKAALLQLSHNLLSFQFDNKVAVTFSLHSIKYIELKACPLISEWWFIDIPSNVYNLISSFIMILILVWTFCKDLYLLHYSLQIAL